MLRNFPRALGCVVGMVGSIVALVAACGSESPPSEFGTSSGSSGNAGSSGFFDTDASIEFPPVECRKMDIVFVIDDSQSMQEEQENLGQNFPKFAQVINDYRTQQGEPLDYRIAVTGTDDTGSEPWDQGRFTRSYGTIEDGCDPGPNNNRWLVREDGDIATFFSCRARLGTTGSNTERPLEAARLALTARIEDGTNTKNGEPFIREDALLALVVITDEDEGGHDGDPSAPANPAKEVTSYAKDFDAVKAGLRGRWAAAVIAGDRECTTGLGKVGEAKRLKQFINHIGPKNGVFSSICEGDLTKGLQDALDLFTRVCKEFPGVK